MSSREKIINAAIDVFAERGRHGARMDEIAVRAGINKAMVYYYFRSKENLHLEALVVILRKAYRRMVQAVERKETSGSNPLTQMKELVAAHFDAFAEEPNFARVFFNALAGDPTGVRQALEKVKLEGKTDPPKKMLAALEDGIAKGFFRDIDAVHTLISIIGMNLIFFADQPMSQTMLGLRITDEKSFLEERKKNIIDLLLHGIVRTGEKEG